MKTSKRAVQFIRDHEGLRLTAYYDQVGVLTIGYGHTSDEKYPVRVGQKITREEAETILVWDISEAEVGLSRMVKVTLNGNQYGALISFIFNVGLGNFRKSSLLAAINRGKKNVSPEFGLWVKGGRPKKTIPGLVRRRAEEAALYATPAALGAAIVSNPPMVGVTSETREAREQKGVVQAGGDPGDLSIKAGPSLTGTGAVADILRDQTDQLSMVAYYSDMIQYAVIALVVAGVGLTICGLIRKLRSK